MSRPQSNAQSFPSAEAKGRIWMETVQALYGWKMQERIDIPCALFG
jgi:hypothetical protein